MIQLIERMAKSGGSCHEELGQEWQELHAAGSVKKPEGG
jgi:hypothetical protein